MTEIVVDIWSDLVCPWCYIGKRRFEAALAGFEHREAVRVRWRSYELDPDGPRDSDLTIPQRMQQDLGLSPLQAAQGADRVTSLAAEAGLTYRLADARPVNSFDAHRLMHFAADRGLGEPVRERLMRAYTAEGAHLADRETLASLAAEAGLDPAAVREVLEREDYTDAVRSDEERARRLGITGVPSFVFGRKYSVSGAQPVEAFADLLRQTWHETTTRSVR
ncbi:DsbA family oxidoreductase [Actinomadura alba]|uniref:DsbA family oxidoreductase n=1 Tax=Actinomadura alba TaxID=406431 RepID=A0ABR7LTU6_9ACTN|nr:DsbA family oxidoreductase [Actinomadura alba]MBC6468277.1 DsbA family oxidoreductase [Actinomadura alba]